MRGLVSRAFVLLLLFLASAAGPALAQAPPAKVGNASLAVTTVSANVAFPQAPPGAGLAVTLVNDGAVELFYELGSSSVAALVTSSALMPGSAVCLNVNNNTNVAAIVSAGNTTLRVTQTTGCPPMSVADGAPGAYPSGATPVTASATGTTNATAATIPAIAGRTAYICGFSIRANATAAATGNATVAGTISGTLNYTQWTAPLASGIGVIEPPIGAACIPASAVNTAIVVTSAAPGAGGVVSVSAWGYYL